MGPLSTGSKVLCSSSATGLLWMHSCSMWHSHVCDRGTVCWAGMVKAFLEEALCMLRTDAPSVQNGPWMACSSAAYSFDLLQRVAYGYHSRVTIIMRVESLRLLQQPLQRMLFNIQNTRGFQCSTAQVMQCDGQCAMWFVEAHLEIVLRAGTVAHKLSFAAVACGCYVHFFWTCFTYKSACCTAVMIDGDLCVQASKLLLSTGSGHQTLHRCDCVSDMRLQLARSCLSSR